MSKKLSHIQTAFLPVLRVVQNKYLVVLVLAGVWMFFFDRYNWQSQMKVSERIESLQEDEQFYENAIENVDYNRNLIFSDLEEMERFARETHHMKRPDEDLYISVKE